MIKKILFMLGAFVTCLSCHLPSDNIVSSDSIVQEDLDSPKKREKRETRGASPTFSSQEDSPPTKEIAGHLIISSPPKKEEIINEIDKDLTGEPLKTLNFCERLPIGNESSKGTIISSKRIKGTNELSQASLKIETTQQNIEIIYAKKWTEDRPLKLEIVKYPHNYPNEKRQGKFYLRVTLNTKELATHNNLTIQLADQSSNVVKECILPQEYFSQNQEGIYRREFEFGQDAD